MSFADDCARHTEQYRKRLAFVAKDATLRLVNDAQRSVSKGGRMRIDTGFLRASIAAKIGGMPSGESANTSGLQYSESETASGTPIAAALIRWRPATETIFIGWVANYARFREYQDGFMRGAVERWPEFVRRAANEAKRKNL